ncbi:MAG TPA: cytochrome c-type biogenesis protein CcmH [Acidiferrobacteraceae bacterium]|nr:cytochrome c-type biogenesis protein CcmH [Acidiferrobacteraceae bacterium]
MKRLVFAVFCCWVLSVQAAVEVYSFANSAQEQRYKKLISELRCLVCQNQNLADSNADLAKDLRRQIHEMLLKGADDKQVVAYMVARYGDFVLYRPPFKLSTALLWIGPFLILVFGILILIIFIRRQGHKAVTELSEQEHARARQLLDGNDDSL